MSAIELGEVVAGGLAAELDDADGDGEEEEHAGHGEEGEQAEDQRLGLLAGEKRRLSDRADQDRRQDSRSSPIWPGRSERSIVAPRWCLARFSHGIAAVRPRSRS